MATVTKLTETDARTTWRVEISTGRVYRVHSYPGSALLYVERFDSGFHVTSSTVIASCRAAIAKAKKGQPC